MWYQRQTVVDIITIRYSLYHTAYFYGYITDVNIIKEPKAIFVKYQIMEKNISCITHVYNAQLAR